MPTLADLRKDYSFAGLTEADAGDDPFVLFHRWLAQAIATEITDPNAMILATATPQLGRLPRAADGDRVLAGPPEPPARPDLLHAPCRGLEARTFGALANTKSAATVYTIPVPFPYLRIAP